MILDKFGMNGVIKKVCFDDNKCFMFSKAMNQLVNLYKVDGSLLAFAFV